MKQTLITLMCSLLAVCAFAQNVTVTGKVTDATGEPLAGASVLTDKGTGNVTDADGAYSLTVPQGTTKKANLTGAVAQVDSKALESRPITNVSQGIQGLMPGITVTGTAGTKKTLYSHL